MGKKVGIGLFLLMFCVASFIAFNYAKKIYFEAVEIAEGERYIYVPSSSSLNSVTSQLYNRGILKDTASFLWVAEKKSFYKPIPGRYLIKDKMSNNQLVNLLRSGMQKPIQLTLNSVRTMPEIASKTSQELELDSLEFMKAWQSKEIAKKYGFSAASFSTMLLPNTYEFYWNTDVDEFMKRMAKEYKRFWTNDRKAKAAALGLSQSEVSILASIVQAEQQEHAEERPKVAGLYINRLKIGMRLQSDPTLIYALGNFSIKRVLNTHKEIQSPYNTYKYAGLPPGPINIPEIRSIEAVLNPADHNYLYMCAKPDFSGYHNFSTNLNQHNRYADAYRRELNRRKILQ